MKQVTQIILLCSIMFITLILTFVISWFFIIGTVLSIIIMQAITTDLSNDNDKLL